MVHDRQHLGENILYLPKIIVLLFFVGGAGGLLATKLVTLFYGGACVAGKAGTVLLLVSACLAAPVALMVGFARHREGRSDAQGVRKPDRRVDR